MKAVAVSVICALFFGHMAYTVYLHTQCNQLRAEMAANVVQQSEQRQRAIADALVTFKTDLGGVMKTMAEDLGETRALAAMGSGFTVGCNGSKFEEGTLGAAAYRAYIRTGACAAQPAKGKRRDD